MGNQISSYLWVNQFSICGQIYLIFNFLSIEFIWKFHFFLVEKGCFRRELGGWREIINLRKSSLFLLLCLFVFLSRLLTQINVLEDTGWHFFKRIRGNSGRSHRKSNENHCKVNLHTICKPMFCAQRAGWQFLSKRF